jgi:hypothetical protein
VSCCSRPPPPPIDASSRDVVADVANERELRDVGSWTDATTADASRDAESWPCRMLPAEVPNVPVYRSDAATCGDRCSLISEFEPTAFIAEDGDTLEYAISLNIFRHVRGRAARVALGASYEAPRALLPPFGATDRSYLIGGTRVFGGVYALGVGTSVEAQREFIDQIHEVDRSTGRSCVRYSEHIPFGERQPGGIVSLRRLNNGYVWRTASTRLLYDVMYLRDGASEPANLTQCGCVSNLAAQGDVAWFTTEDVNTDATELWAFTEHDQRARARWVPTRPNTVTRISVDPTDGRRVSMNLGVGGSFCPRHMDIAVATLDELDAGQAPRRITDDDATQSISAVRGRWLVFTDYSNDPSTPNGCPDEPHSRVDIVLHDLDTGTRRILNTGTSAMSPEFIGRDSVYIVNRWGMGIVSYP